MNDPAFSNYGESLSYHRQKARLTQKALARKANSTRGRVSDVELNRRPPTDSEVAAFARVLKKNLNAFGPRLKRRGPRPPRRTKLPFGSGTLKRFKRERPNFCRFRKARERDPILYQQLLKLVRARGDKPLVGRYIHDMVAESDNEAMWEMHKLAGRGSPISVSPQKTGLRFLQVVTPDLRQLLIGDLPFPALEFFEPYHCVLFPQVTLAGNPPCRPDNLLGIRIDGKTEWAIVEVNGIGHQERLQDPPLPKIVLTDVEVRSPDCLEIFWSKVEAMVQANFS